MTNSELAVEIAKGLIETGVEGGFDAVSCTTSGGDYPSIGCSQWEGARADVLLSYIDGGDYYAGRTYSDIEESDELEDLAELLDSPQGHEAQLMMLAADCENYVEAITGAGLDDSRSIIYAGIWCPTSHYVVASFLRRRLERGYEMNDLAECADTFRREYAIAADCEDYAPGYANRAVNTFKYVRDLDLSEYGVPEYDGELPEDEEEDEEE